MTPYQRGVIKGTFQGWLIGGIPAAVFMLYIGYWWMTIMFMAGFLLALKGWKDELWK